MEVAVSSSDRKRFVAVVVTRRRQVLKSRLQTANIEHRFLSFEEAEEDLMRQAEYIVIIDTVGSTAPELMAMLRMLRRCVTAAILIVDPADHAAQRLAAFCPNVRVLVSEHADFSEVRPWVKLLPYEDRRYCVQRQPWVVRVPAHAPLSCRSDLAALLDVLYAAPTMEVAAYRSGLSRVTLQRVLRALRVELALPPGNSVRFGPQDLAATIYQALGSLTHQSGALGGD
jgi:hypothetical protein